MLDVVVTSWRGASRDTREKSGAASLTLGLMGLGAQGLEEEQISERFADVGAQPSGRFDADRAGFSLRTLSSAAERNQALDLMARILQQPTFPQAILEREKARVLAGLRESDTKPETISDREFRRIIYGNHPYGLRGSGEIETVEKLTRADLEEFYQRYYVSDAAIVSIIRRHAHHRLALLPPTARQTSVEIRQADTRLAAAPALGVGRR
jgi:zinc protease